MGRLIYCMNVSLDGYVADREGGLGWADVDEELHTWFNDFAREATAFVNGRRLYELMAAYWPTAASDPLATPAMLDFARIWVDKPKFVVSSTLTEAAWNSRLVSGDVGAELARLRAELDGDIDLGGPTLAAECIRLGLVDEYRLLVHPVVIGGGTPFFPALDTPIRLRQIESQRFDSGVVYLGFVPR